MRHHKRVKKFGREKNQRVALMKTLAVSLVREGKIKTTETKAKSLRPFVERLVSIGKTNTPASRRLIASRIGNVGAKTLMTKISPKYTDRNGGFTRVVKLSRRESDGTRMAVIEFV